MKIFSFFLICGIFILQLEFGEFQVTFPENTAATTTTKGRFSYFYN